MSISRWMVVTITAFFITISCIALSETDNVSILSRSGWGAKAPIKKMTPHTPTRITVHHTATRQKPKQSLKAKMKALQQFSQSAGKLANGKLKEVWADVPYHFYISATGEVAEGRAVNFSGDTNTNYDPKGHISIVMEGNFNDEVPKLIQASALVRLITFLAGHYKIETETIGGHRQHASTSCPGNNLHSVLEQIKQDVVKEQRPAFCSFVPWLCSFVSKK